MRRFISRCNAKLQIEREKLYIFRVFMHVPLSILKRLAQQSQTSLEAMQDASETDGNDQDTGGIGDEVLCVCSLL
jgi:hypothetical protein